MTNNWLYSLSKRVNKIEIIKSDTENMEITFQFWEKINPFDAI